MVHTFCNFSSLRILHVTIKDRLFLAVALGTWMTLGKFVLRGNVLQSDRRTKAEKELNPNLNW